MLAYVFGFTLGMGVEAAVFYFTGISIISLIL